MVGETIIWIGEENNYNGRVTVLVVMTCIISAAGGLIFGYGLGISQGVTCMDMFLSKFFPNVLRKMKRSHTNVYCKFDSQLLTTFTSSLYLAGMIASLFASSTTRLLGRKYSMLMGGAFFLVGAALNGAAENIVMLIIDRILLGIGIGFTNQSVPVYLSEMAPLRLRGGLNILFDLFITIGILAANLINYGTRDISGWGWRLSLVLAAVPGLIMTLGSLGLPDTPNSLIERGKQEEACSMLQKLLGTASVDEELSDLIATSEASRQVKHPWRNILQRKYRPQLVMSICIPMFQQLTGINVITFYAAVLLESIGFDSNASLLSSVITGVVNVLATVVSSFSVDKVGRRFLFLEGGVQMLISQVVIAGILGSQFGSSGQGSLSKGYAVLVLVFICIYVAAFALSWGSLGWLFPSEIFPLEIRSVGQSINVSVNLFFSFAVAQLFLPALCHVKYKLFLAFSGCVIVMTVFVYLLLPETKNVPIEEMDLVWRCHWFWSKFFDEEEAVQNDVVNGNEKVKQVEP